MTESFLLPILTPIITLVFPFVTFAFFFLLIEADNFVSRDDIRSGQAFEKYFGYEDCFDILSEDYYGNALDEEKKF